MTHTCAIFISDMQVEFDVFTVLSTGFGKSQINQGYSVAKSVLLQPKLSSYSTVNYSCEEQVKNNEFKRSLNYFEFELFQSSQNCSSLEFRFN